ncbi:hypothetical protein H6B13_03305 [Bacteroides gallinaceum]|uniref:hypothetical protein n=1 Tax=Bacteroides gallinaceum TaxID=1462571 RepID=UPI00195A4A38|nr:hypothetical protein [Bacteroides gallinaceum]MBM6718674.1 hypothetical protein [Bacteroides gallinaceum]
MDNNRIYQKIYDIASQLLKENAVYTRADLAYELQDFGIKADSFEIGMLVWKAYKYFNDNEAIRHSFYDNEKKDPLVDEYRTDYLIETNDNTSLFPLLQQKLAKGNQALNQLENTVTQTLQEQAVSGSISTLNTLTGTQGIVKVKNEATAVFNLYSELVGNYDDAKHQIQAVTTDFVKLRGQICDTYRQYALVLTDAFGDSIKTVSPELFDFDSIEWLDVHGMLQNVKLDYDKINEKCSTLMSSITDSFAQSLKTASQSYKAAGSKQIGLVLAGLNMVSHYIDAGQKTAELKQDLLTLKNSVKHDVTLIKGDMGRLFVIYKTLNDLYIPQAEAFCRFSKQVLSGEWQQLTKALYADTDIQSLKEERDEALESYKTLEREMTDEQLNIDYYTTRIEECRQLLDGMQTQYQQAQASKPEKPFFLTNLLTLGSAKQKYNRNIYDWNQACAPVISQYEEMQTDMKLDSDELEQLQQHLNENKRTHQLLKEKLHRLNREIMNNINVSPALQMKLLPHLESMVKLLRIAREIANSKLDNKLVKTVSITRQNTELPQELKQNLQLFADTLREHASIDDETAKNSFYAVSDEYPTDSRQSTSDGNVTEADFAQLSDAENTAIQNTVNLLESWSRLKAMQEQSAIAHQAYDKELEKLQEAFRNNLADIDNRGVILRESLKKINTATSEEELKEGLLSLAQKEGESFSKEEWNEFLNGTKTIEL